VVRSSLQPDWLLVASFGALLPPLEQFANRVVSRQLACSDVRRFQNEFS
jgi:hypothetical protein